jgi:hypothetical protein
MYEVGMEIDAWCGQCKVDRRCAVASLNPDGTIERVTCTFCQTSRNYRPPQGQPRTPERTPVTALRGEGVREFTVHEDELRSLIRSVVREEFEAYRAPIADKWVGGTLVMKPGKPGVQEKEVPIDTFFHKIVMLRDRLRVLEQQINAHDKLSEAEKLSLQQYITRCYGSLTTFNILFKDKNDYFVGSKVE